MSDPSEQADRPADSGSELTHVDARGRAKMVDVGDKDVTERTAEARGLVRLTPSLRERLFSGDLPKGEALAVARVAGIQAAKETSRLIPMCHAVALTSVKVDFARCGEDAVEVTAIARCRDRTGVEMEALTAVSVAALTIYDMVKAMCRGASIEGVELVAKSGGRSGDWRKEDSTS